ncbi:MAG: cupin domain-containing protein [Planctomycetes bacterium]|nr:cupin domain-containing protein [Planctomycetota bacterium]
MPSPTPIHLHEKLAQITAHWSPRVVAELNDLQFKLVKFEGEFVWHVHEDTDEAFLVLHGEMEIGLEEGVVRLGVGDLYVVKKGVRHITRAERECHVLVLEPRGVVNTGDAGGTLTAPNDVWV